MGRKRNAMRLYFTHVYLINPESTGSAHRSAWRAKLQLSRWLEKWYGHCQMDISYIALVWLNSADRLS
jgi:hypothetical protein